MAMETETPPEEESQEEVLLPDTTIVTHCIYKNDLERLVKSFEDDTDPYKDSINELMNERDEDGKSPLDLAASFGRVDICRELLKRGADLTLITEKGLYKRKKSAIRRFQLAQISSSSSFVKRPALVC